MLKSLSRHFNETVFRGPETEGGGGDVEDVIDTGGVDDVSDGDAGGGDTDGEVSEGKPLSVREEIKKAMSDAAEPPPVKAKKDPKTGKFAKEAKPGEAGPAPAAGDPPPAPASIPAPASLSAEAKAVWDQAPEALKAAFIKRETDSAAGVAELKQRYNLIDQAISPHTDALRQMNATPADAVNRMFLWFKALAGKPGDAFPALTKSMGIDWNTLASQAAGSPAPTAAEPGAAPAPGAPEIPEPVKQYVTGLESKVAELSNIVHQIGGRFGSMEQNFQNQSEMKTRENLSIWSKDLPYFEEVRADMARLIETGMVPVKADGQVDLDTAYERAIHFNPEVRAKVLAAQQQANQQVQQQSKEAATTAQQTQVNRARKAASSLPASTTPGAANGAATGTKRPGQKTSVRDSLRASIAQLRDQ